MRKKKPETEVPAAIATVQARDPQKEEWQARTHQTMRDNRRHPLKLKPDPRKPSVLTLAESNSDTVKCQLFATTGFIDRDGSAWLMQQIINGNNGEASEAKANGLLSMVEGLSPQNALEGMLAAQMTTCHNMAMNFSRRTTAEGQSVDAVDRNVNRVTKLMRTFTAQVEALQRLRNQGQQRITVQHVQVGHGGQAIIGDVHPGGEMGA